MFLKRCIFCHKSIYRISFLRVLLSLQDTLLIHFFMDIFIFLCSFNTYFLPLTPVLWPFSLLNERVGFFCIFQKITITEHSSYLNWNVTVFFFLFLPASIRTIVHWFLPVRLRNLYCTGENVPAHSDTGGSPSLSLSSCFPQFSFVLHSKSKAGHLYLLPISFSELLIHLFFPSHLLSSLPCHPSVFVLPSY